MNKKCIAIVATLLVVILALVYVVFFWQKPQASTTINESGGNATQADVVNKFFKLVTANNKNVTGIYTMRFGDDQIQASVCNGISGGYVISDGKLRQEGSWMSTKRGCIGEAAEMEKKFDTLLESDPSISISGDNLTLSGDGLTFIFVRE